MTDNKAVRRGNLAVPLHHTEPGPVFIDDPNGGNALVKWETWERVVEALRPFGEAIDRQETDGVVRFSPEDFKRASRALAEIGGE